MQSPIRTYQLEKEAQFFLQFRHVSIFLGHSWLLQLELFREWCLTREGFNCMRLADDYQSTWNQTKKDIYSKWRSSKCKYSGIAALTIHILHHIWWFLLHGHVFQAVAFTVQGLFIWKLRAGLQYTLLCRQCGFLHGVDVLQFLFFKIGSFLRCFLTRYV